MGWKPPDNPAEQPWTAPTVAQTDHLRQLRHQMLVPNCKSCRKSSSKNTFRHTTVSESGHLLSCEPTDVPAAVQYFQWETHFVASDPTSLAKPDTQDSDPTLIPLEAKQHDCRVQNQLHFSNLTKTLQHNFLTIRKFCAECVHFSSNRADNLTSSLRTNEN